MSFQKYFKRLQEILEGFTGRQVCIWRFSGVFRERFRGCREHHGLDRLLDEFQGGFIRFQRGSRMFQGGRGTFQWFRNFYWIYRLLDEFQRAFIRFQMGSRKFQEGSSISCLVSSRGILRHFREVPENGSMFQGVEMVNGRLQKILPAPQKLS